MAEGVRAVKPRVTAYPRPGDTAYGPVGAELLGMGFSDVVGRDTESEEVGRCWVRHSDLCRVKAVRWFAGDFWSLQNTCKRQFYCEQYFSLVFRRFTRVAARLLHKLTHKRDGTASKGVISDGSIGLFIDLAAMVGSECTVGERSIGPAAT